MSKFTFNLPSGETFEIKMPSGATFEQAQALFKQQVDTGGLTGFKVGDALNAATQAADGLASAQSQAQQTFASVAGKLPQGTDLKTLTASVGPALAGAANQSQSALTGAGAAIASLTTGASAAVNAAISGITGTIKSGVSALGAGTPAGFAESNSKLPVSTSVLQGGLSSFTGQISQVGSLANNAVKGITSALSGTPLNGINIADFAKQGPSLGPIANLTKADVTGVMAQATKLIGQGPGDLTNTGGLGKFGFDAKQLETAGFLKPGTAAAFLKTGNAELSAVLSSPLSWTGKGGVKGASDLLSNSKLQDKIQQDLMKTGLDSVKQLGLPVDKLAPTALGGVATLAAKDPAGAVAALTGGAGLPGTPNLGNLTNKVKDVMSNSAFAVKLTEGKVEPPLKQEEPAPAETNTVDTATVNAAGERIVGNDKVPTVTVDGSVSAAKAAVFAYLDFLTTVSVSLGSLETKIIALIGSFGGISQEQWNTLNEEYLVVKATFNSRQPALQLAMTEAINATPEGNNRANLVAAGQSAQSLAKTIVQQAIRVKKYLSDLSSKIRT